MTGRMFPYFSSSIGGPEKPDWLLLHLSHQKTYSILRTTRGMGLASLLGACGGGEIWRRFLTCVMLSRVYNIEIRNRLTEINASSTSVPTGKKLFCALKLISNTAKEILSISKD